MLIKTAIKSYVMGVVVIIWAASPALADFGPLQTTNRFPLHLMFIKPRPVKANLPAKGEVDISLAVEYSNTYFQHASSSWDVLIDMEMMVVDFSFVWGASSRLAFRLDLPLVSMNNGFLDEFLGDYHDFIGARNYDRENRPDDTFGYRVFKDGEQWIDGDSGELRGADTTVSVQYALIAPSRHSKVASSLILSVKMPIGDEQSGFGSGAFDYGLYWPTHWTGHPWSFYIMPSIAFIGDPKSGGADVSARNSYGLFCGTAYDYSERLTMLAQLNYYSSPLEKTGINELDGGTLELGLGFHYRLKAGWIVEFAFCEDLTRAAPDFNVRLGFQWKIK